MRAGEVVACLDADTHARSGLVREAPSGKPCPEVFVAFPIRGCMWVKMNGSYVSGWTDHGAYHGKRFGIFNRMRIKAAVRRWLARQEPPQ